MDSKQNSTDSGATPKRRLSWLYLLAGLLCVGLAAAGTILPLLPTTPFLLLAAACFARSSAKLHRWLHSNRLFGPYLLAYRNGEGIPLKAKITTLLLLWLSLGTSLLLAVPPHLWFVRLALMLIGAGVTIHILRIKTRRQEKEGWNLTSAASTQKH